MFRARKLTKKLFPPLVHYKSKKIFTSQKINVGVSYRGGFGKGVKLKREGFCFNGARLCLVGPVHLIVVGVEVQ